VHITSLSKENYQIELSASELDVLINCLKEAIKRIEDFEFQTRVGVTKEHVKTLLEIMLDGRHKRS